MKFLGRPVLCILLAFLATSAFAQQQNSITRELEVGALFTTGNTDEQALNFAGDIAFTRNQWEYGFNLDGLYASSDNETKGQRFYGIASANYEFTEDSFFQARASHEDDRFSGFDSQSDFTVSYRRGFMRSRSDMDLILNTGVGIRWSRLNGSDFDEPILRVAGEYEWIISNSATFSQELAVEYGTDSNIYRSDTGITTQILENLSLRFSLRLKHQTEVPSGRDETDSETAVTFVMNF
jgi:putative salt-induced outer membrane protein|tara:strand:- start:6288 stop:7001 length:714 start_codon:yes stop_codon:yes gene_type:complete